MSKRLRLVILAALLASTRSLWAAPRASRMIQYASGSQKVSGYLALPDSGGRHPGVIVIHEWWGLNNWVKGEADRLASHGYVALAVDLYRGKSTTDPEVAHELMRGLPEDRARRDLEAAFAYLVSRPDVEPDKIGVVGWCMGGGYSILLAEHEPKLAACVVNYGALPTEPEDIARIEAPVLGNFGADDRGITPQAVHAFEIVMEAAGKSVDVKIFEGAGHAFENPNNKAGYRPEAAKNAWGRTLAFLEDNLK
jgi:carboxymethylenebutenolidase